MRNLIIPSMLALFVLVGCQKNSADTAAPVTPEAPKPVSAAFKISAENIFENQDIVLTPTDTRAGNTYFWDFGLINNKRVTSADMIPSLKIKSHGNYYATLTVTDAKGNTATLSQFMPVLCSWDGTGVHP